MLWGMSVFDFENMYCGLIRRGDIFLCEIESKKEVPVVVLQDTVLNGGLSSVVCAFIEPIGLGHTLLINEVLLSKDETGLGKESVCVTHKVRAIDRQTFISKKGEVASETLKKIFCAFDMTLGRFRE